MPSRRRDAGAYLACDAGSSSYKAALFDVRSPVPEDAPPPRWQGSIAWKRLPGNASMRSHWEGGRSSESHVRLERRDDAPARLLNIMMSTAPDGSSGPRLQAAAHRVVHTGDLERSPAVVTADVVRAIDAAQLLAPEHNALALEGIDAVAHRFPGVRQFVVSDSAYHATLPAEASNYAVPASWRKVWGIRRRGFHGISHAYAARRCARLMGASPRSLRIVTCHLGNGCSLAATAGGKSVDTTMGWTPMEGLVMGTRSGSIDPGVVLYLIECGRYTAAELTRVLNEESGLRGISGLSGDMREILDKAAGGHPRARLALDVFVHRLRAGVAAMASAMDGLDALVFTGGVGENAHEVRREACAGLRFLGVKLDERRNAHDGEVDADIAKRSAGPRIFVIHAREMWAMARECALAGAAAE
jgi:acetate kinase